MAAGAGRLGIEADIEVGVLEVAVAVTGAGEAAVGMGAAQLAGALVVTWGSIETNLEDAESVSMEGKSVAVPFTCVRVGKKCCALSVLMH